MSLLRCLRFRGEVAWPRTPSWQAFSPQGGPLLAFDRTGCRVRHDWATFTIIIALSVAGFPQQQSLKKDLRQEGAPAGMLEGETRKGKRNARLSVCSFVWPAGHACWHLFLVVHGICMEVWVDQMALLCLSFRNWYLQRDPGWKGWESKAGSVFYKLETLPNIFQRWLWFLPLIIVCSQSRVVFQIFNN